MQSTKKTQPTASEGMLELKKRWSGPEGLLLLLLAAGAAIRFYYSWQPIPVLLEQGMADDAFYYLNIARNIARGLGISFDGIWPTNGFHPLYTGLIVPLFRIFPTSPDLVVRLSLSVLMLFNLLTSLPLYFTVKQVSSPQAGLFAVLLWLFNPWVLIFSLGGVESSLYIFFVAVSIFLALQPPGRWFSRTALLGLCLGLMLLARSDGVFLFSAILFDGFIRPLWSGAPGAFFRNREVIGQAIVLLLVSGLTFAPWLLWNLVTFGGPIQVSGMAVYWQTHSNALTTALKVSRLQGSILRTLYGGLYFSVQTILIGALLVIVRLVLQKRGPPALEGDPRNLRERLGWVLGLYAFQILAFYGVYLWQQQFWYFMPVLYIAAVLGGIFFGDILKTVGISTLSFRVFIQAVALLAVLLPGGIIWWNWHTGALQIYPAQRNAIRIAAEISSRTDPNARMGSWNSGILGFLSERTTIDLDGVVNNRLYEYVRTRDVSFFDLCGIWDYIKSTEIDYLTDYEDVWTEEFDHTFQGHLELWSEFPADPTVGSYPIKIYRVLDNPGALPVASCPEAIRLLK